MGETIDRLKACGIKIEEDLQIIAVFASLPPEYDPLVTTIVSTPKATTRDPSLIQLKMEFITNLLLNEETCHIQI
jgi:gag-polypeptide of LTR copia-type